MRGITVDSGLSKSAVSSTLHQQETVPSGSFSVHGKSAVVLKAHLGSCVGVALIDRKAGIGGLFHILLPEPPGTYDREEARRYASTGLPLFIQALTEAGAEINSMEAWVAGGALVGTVSQLDLELDIGGRTAELVAGFLGEKNIPIKKLETGGYVSSTISLSCSDFSCEISPVGVPKSEPRGMTVKLESAKLEEAIEKVRPIPQIALKVIRMIHSDKVSMNAIAAEIRQDNVLSAKVIQLSNSVFVSASRKIESIDEALVYMGEKRILLMTVSIFTELYYQKADKGYSLCKGGLHQHAVGVALIAEKFAQLTGVASPDLAYTAGLVHDIGKTVLDQFVADDYPLLYRKLMENNNQSIEKTEKEILGMSHTEIGARLARTWALPDSLTEVIALHHNPEKATVNPHLTNLVFLANLILSKFRAGITLAGQGADKVRASLEYLHIKPQHLPKLIDFIPWNEFEKAGLGH